MSEKGGKDDATALETERDLNSSAAAGTGTASSSTPITTATPASPKSNRKLLRRRNKSSPVRANQKSPKLPRKIHLTEVPDEDVVASPELPPAAVHCTPCAHEVTPYATAEASDKTTEEPSSTSHQSATAIDIAEQAAVVAPNASAPAAFITSEEGEYVDATALETERNSSAAAGSGTSSFSTPIATATPASSKSNRKLLWLRNKSSPLRANQKSPKHSRKIHLTEVPAKDVVASPELPPAAVHTPCAHEVTPYPTAEVSVMTTEEPLSTTHASAAAIDIAEEATVVASNTSASAAAMANSAAVASAWTTTTPIDSRNTSNSSSTSFAAIMADQESISREEHDELCLQLANDLRREREERELQLAMQMSMEQVNAYGPSSLDESSPDDGLDEEMRLAMAMSMQGNQEDQLIRSGHRDGQTEGITTAASGSPMSQKQEVKEQEFSPQKAKELHVISDQEAAEIEIALKEADAAAEAESMRLAMQLQKEEATRYLSATHSSCSQRQQQGQGHVRTVTRDEYLLEQSGGTAHHVTDYQQEEGQKQPADAGFRMNSSTPSQSWTRIDRSTIIGPNNEVRTKHDLELQGQANAHRLGLDMDEDTLVGNKAYNSFQRSMQRKMNKGVEKHGHGRATADTDRTRGGGMDSNVRLQITKAINNGLLECCNGVVKEGKEAIVYHGNKGAESGGFDVAVKVFKRIQDFKQRGTYVDGDPRYRGKQFSNAGSREQLEIWAEKEYRNLVRANRAGVPVPTPLLQKENILFMRFLGDDGWPAPQLKEIDIKKGSKKWKTLYSQTMAGIGRLYHSARLVHGDLSEYNILVCPSKLVENRDEENGSDENAVQVVLIDFGQAVDYRHPDAMELLRRDLTRVQEFFSKMGIKALDPKTAEEFVMTWEEDETNVASAGPQNHQEGRSRDVPEPKAEVSQSETTAVREASPARVQQELPVLPVEAVVDANMAGDSHPEIPVLWAKIEQLETTAAREAHPGGAEHEVAAHPDETKPQPDVGEDVMAKQDVHPEIPVLWAKIAKLETTASREVSPNVQHEVPAHPDEVVGDNNMAKGDVHLDTPILEPAEKTSQLETTTILESSSASVQHEISERPDEAVDEEHTANSHVEEVVGEDSRTEGNAHPEIPAPEPEVNVSQTETTETRDGFSAGVQPKVPAHSDEVNVEKEDEHPATPVLEPKANIVHRETSAARVASPARVQHDVPAHAHDDAGGDNVSKGVVQGLVSQFETTKAREASKAPVHHEVPAYPDEAAGDGNMANSHPDEAVDEASLAKGDVHTESPELEQRMKVSQSESSAARDVSPAGVQREVPVHSDAIVTEDSKAKGDVNPEIPVQKPKVNVSQTKTAEARDGSSARVQQEVPAHPDEVNVEKEDEHPATPVLEPEAKVSQLELTDIISQLEATASRQASPARVQAKVSADRDEAMDEVNVEKGDEHPEIPVLSQAQESPPARVQDEVPAHSDEAVGGDHRANPHSDEALCENVHTERPALEPKVNAPELETTAAKGASPARVQHKVRAQTHSDQVVGDQSMPKGHVHAELETPVPEPDTKATMLETIANGEDSPAVFVDEDDMSASQPSLPIPWIEVPWAEVKKPKPKPKKSKSKRTKSRRKLLSCGQQDVKHAMPNGNNADVHGDAASGFREHRLSASSKQRQLVLKVKLAAAVLEKEDAVAALEKAQNSTDGKEVMRLVSIELAKEAVEAAEEKVLALHQQLGELQARFDEFKADMEHKDGDSLAVDGNNKRPDKFSQDEKRLMSRSLNRKVEEKKGIS